MQPPQRALHDGEEPILAVLRHNALDNAIKAAIDRERELARALAHSLRSVDSARVHNAPHEVQLRPEHDVAPRRVDAHRDREEARLHHEGEPLRSEALAPADLAPEALRHELVDEAVEHRKSHARAVLHVRPVRQPLVRGDQLGVCRRGAVVHSD